MRKEEARGDTYVGHSPRFHEQLLSRDSLRVCPLTKFPLTPSLHWQYATVGHVGSSIVVKACLKITRPTPKSYHQSIETIKNKDLGRLSMVSTPRPGLNELQLQDIGLELTTLAGRERKSADTTGIQWWLPVSILKYKNIFSNKKYGSNFIKQHSETVGSGLKLLKCWLQFKNE